MVLLKHGAGHPGLICYVIVPLVVELHFPSSSIYLFFIQSQFQEPCFMLFCSLV